MKKINPFRMIGSLLIMAALCCTGCGTKRKLVDMPRERTIHILAVNDMHAALDNFPRFAYMVDSLRTLYPDLLLVSSGDNQTGNPINDQYPEKGLPMIELMNALRFDISSVGNHEFDTRQATFAALTQKAHFPFVCANVAPIEGCKIVPYVIMTRPNGLRIAFTSVLFINSLGIPDTHPDNTTGFGFTDPTDAAIRWLTLRDSADLLIYLNHFGFEDDVKLANRLPAASIDVIIGGHSHTKIDTEQVHNGILITQAERRLKYATLLTLTLHHDGRLTRRMKLMDVGKTGNTRPDIAAMVARYNDNSPLKAIVADADADFTSKEQVGYLMADALRHATKTDMALVNPGGVRIDRLSKGAVAKQDVYEMDPFGNEAVLFNLTAHELRALLLSGFEMDERQPIYSSGFHSRYTLKADGSIADVQLLDTNGKPLDPNKTFRVAMNNYAASVYKYEHKDPGTSLSTPTAELMVEYLQQLKRIPDYRNQRRIEMVTTPAK